MISEIRAWLYRHVAMDAEGNPKSWITVNGNRIPVFEGQTKKEAAKKFIEGHKKEKHPRNKVPKMSQRRNKNVEITEEHVKNVYDTYSGYLKSGKYNAHAVITEAANQLRGNVTRFFPGFGQEKVFVDAPFVNHAAAFIARSDAGKIGIAERQLFAMSKVYDIIRHGKVIQRWHNDPNHHPTYDFMVLQKEYDLNGKKVKVTLDLRKPHNKKTSEAEKHAYSFNVEGNPTFAGKERNIALKNRSRRGFTGDSALDGIEVYGISIE